MKITIIGSHQYLEKMFEHHDKLVYTNEVRMPMLDQDSDDELEIARVNMRNIAWADEVHLFWDRRSIGTIMDLGGVIAHQKPLKIIYLEPLKLENVFLKYANVVEDSHGQLSLDSIQKEVEAWSAKNFGSQEALNPLLGIGEEYGELLHIILKRRQGIRNSDSSAEQERDSIGDLLIYLLDYCSRRNFSLAEILQETWQEVKKRDWKKFPEDGTAK